MFPQTRVCYFGMICQSLSSWCIEGICIQSGFIGCFDTPQFNSSEINDASRKSLILVKDIPREIKNTRENQQSRLRLKGHLSYLDNCLCCMTGSESGFLGNHGHQIVEEDWYKIAFEFEIPHHMSQSNCSTLPSVTNHHELQ